MGNGLSGKRATSKWEVAKWEAGSVADVHAHAYVAGPADPLPVIHQKLGSHSATLDLEFRVRGDSLTSVAPGTGKWATQCGAGQARRWPDPRLALRSLRSGLRKVTPLGLLGVVNSAAVWDHGPMA